MAEFVHLHLHTEFSLLDGACRIDELLDHAAALKMPAIGVTEHGNMFSSVIFHDHARARGLKPILGCEVYVAPGSRLTKSGNPGETANHLILLAETHEGYSNLIKLVSAGYTEGFYYKPRIDKELLSQHSKGLIGMSSCLKGEVAEGLSHQQERKAIDAAAAYRDILGPDNFFLEMQWHGIEDQRIVNSGLPGLAKDLKLPLVCTNDVHYLRETDAHPHDVLLCIGTGKAFTDPKRLRYDSRNFFLKTPEQMAEAFRDYPDALANTMRIAERCDVRIPEGENFLPNFDVPPAFTLDGYFEHIVRAGFAERLPRLQHLASVGALRHTVDEYETRLAYEIAMIKKMKYPGYFLITWDFIRYAREQGIPVGPGRGSAAGSLVAYCMRITDVDPLSFDLIFERFLNPERVSLPDIDIDFCERRRGEVIEYVTKKYGRENVAQIITFGTMKAKAVVRDVGRVLEMPFADVDKVAKQIPAALDMTLDKALEENPILRDMEKNDPKVKELLSVAKRLEGMTRHASVHAAGVVIAPSAITNYAPLYKGARDEIVTQWSMKEIERVGLLKMDFLGLSTLTLISDAIEEIQRTTGETLDIDHVPLDDAKTYQLFQDGQTYGVFQFESSGMRDILRKSKPQRLDDLIALNALYRPGPLRSGMVDDYIARKQGKTEVVYELPELEPVLADTYGVIAYQEQVMRISNIVAGFTLGEADILRKAMGKKKAEVMQAQRAKFVDGAKKRGVNEKKAAHLFDLMEHFAGYGFNKSHSTTYAYLAYQTAYLKANYPWHFAAALFTIESQNTEKLAMYLGEARERGIPVLPPDINQSQLRFTVEEAGVRFGLTAIKNVGEGAIESLLKVRATQGRITSLAALCEELDLRLFNKRVFESLAKAGALDSLAAGVAGHSRETRPRIVAAVDAACEYGARQQRDREQGQGGLFGEVQESDAAAGAGQTLPPATAWTEQEQLAFEKETLGLYWSGHPVDRYRTELKEFGARTIAELSETPVSVEPAATWGPGGRKPMQADTSVGGVIAAVRQLKTKKGDRMAVFTLEDAQANVEVIVFPETFAKSVALIDTGTLVLVRGKLERDDETARVLATEILPLDSVRERVAREVAIRVKMPADRRMFEALGEVFSRHRGDRRVSFEIEVPSEEKPLRVRADVSTQIRVRPSSTLISEVEQIVGHGFGRIALMPETLDFEEPVAPLLKELDDLLRLPRTDSAQREIDALQRRIDAARAGVYASLSPWQRVQVARHPNRPGFESFLSLIFDGFVEIHGDRRFADDHAIMTGFAEYKGQPVLVVGHVKGVDTKEKIFRNFGYARPEGYRKALRTMRLAEKFRRPVIVFIDTPAAYPGIESEERGVAEAIAVNLRDMMMLDTPVIVIVSGEGGSGGALGIAVGDAVLMQEYAIYSVIPPEGCAAILWRDPSKKVEASAALKLTAPDLLKAGIIDQIIPEPVGGAHTNPEAAAALVVTVLDQVLADISALDSETRLARRYDKFRNMGRIGIDFVDEE